MTEKTRHCVPAESACTSDVSWLKGGSCSDWDAERARYTTAGSGPAERGGPAKRQSGWPGTGKVRTGGASQGAAAPGGAGVRSVHRVVVRVRWGERGVVRREGSAGVRGRAAGRAERKAGGVIAGGGGRGRGRGRGRVKGV